MSAVRKLKLVTLRVPKGPEYTVGCALELLLRGASQLSVDELAVALESLNLNDGELRAFQEALVLQAHLRKILSRCRRPLPAAVAEALGVRS